MLVHYSRQSLAVQFTWLYSFLLLVLVPFMMIWGPELPIWISPQKLPSHSKLFPSFPSLITLCTYRVFFCFLVVGLVGGVRKCSLWPTLFPVSAHTPLPLCIYPSTHQEPKINAQGACGSNGRRWSAGKEKPFRRFVSLPFTLTSQAPQLQSVRGACVCRQLVFAGILSCAQRWLADFPACGERENVRSFCARSELSYV